MKQEKFNPQPFLDLVKLFTHCQRHLYVCVCGRKDKVGDPQTQAHLLYTNINKGYVMEAIKFCVEHHSSIDHHVSITIRVARINFTLDRID